MKCEGCDENNGSLIYIDRPRKFKLCWACIKAVHQLYADLVAVRPELADR